MCGRFAQSIPLGKLNKIDLFDEIKGEYRENYNVAPSQDAFSVFIINGRRIIKPMKWGLIPSWTKPDKKGSGIINARFETLSEKSHFKNSYRRQRCVIPVTGFFEWQKSGKNKIPYFVCGGRDKDDEYIPLFICGIYDRWISPEGEEEETFAVITTESAAEMKTIHERMPLVVERDNLLLWLGDNYSHEKHSIIIKSFKTENLSIFRVSEYVNSYANNSSQCINPV